MDRDNELKARVFDAMLQAKGIVPEGGDAAMKQSLEFIEAIQVEAAPRVVKYGCQCDECAPRSVELPADSDLRHIYDRLDALKKRLDDAEGPINCPRHSGPRGIDPTKECICCAAGRPNVGTRLELEELKADIKEVTKSHEELRRQHSLHTHSTNMTGQTSTALVVR